MKDNWFRRMFLLSDDPEIARKQKRNTAIFVIWKLSMPFIISGMARAALRHAEKK